MSTKCYGEIPVSSTYSFRPVSVPSPDVEMKESGQPDTSSDLTNRVAALIREESYEEAQTLASTLPSDSELMKDFRPSAPPDFRVYLVFKRIIDTYMQHGDFEAAVQIANLNMSAERRDESLISIVERCLEVENFEMAEKIAPMISYPASLTASALIRGSIAILMQKYIAAGKIDEARVILSSMSAKRQSEASVEIVKGYVQVGDFEKAIQLINETSNLSDRYFAMVELVKGFVNAKEFTRALECAGSIPALYDYYRDPAVFTIVEGYIKIKEFNKAFALVKTISDKYGDKYGYVKRGLESVTLDSAVQMAHLRC